MVPLTRDGIIVSTLGRNGSIHLGRPAESITLRDIYVSVIEDKSCGRRGPMCRPAVWSAPTPAGTSSLSPTKQSRPPWMCWPVIPWQARWKRSKGDTSGCELLPELDILKSALILPSAQNAFTPKA